MPSNNIKISTPFWWIETATHVPASAMLGLVAATYAGFVTVLFTLIFTLILLPLLGWWALLLAAPLARLTALDLTTHTLPDVYTLPLLAVGLAYALEQGGQGAFGQVICALGLVGVPIFFTRAYGVLGGGDYKLIAAMVAALGLTGSAWALLVGGVVCLPLWAYMAFTSPKAPVPLGVPLVLGAVVGLYIRVDWFL